MKPPLTPSRILQVNSIFFCLLVFVPAVFGEPTPRPNDAFLSCVRALRRLGTYDFSLLTSAKATSPGYPLAAEVREVAQHTLLHRDYLKFQEWYLSHFFFVPVEQLLDNVSSSDTRVRPSEKYNQNGERPFHGYQKARSYLMGGGLEEFELRDLEKAHTALLSKDSVDVRQLKPGESSRNSEKEDTRNLGIFRDVPVGLEADPADPVVRKYLPRLGAGRGVYSPGSFDDAIENNPYLSKTTYFPLEYMPLKEWRKVESQLSPSLRQVLVQLEAQGKDFSSLEDAEVNKARRSYVTELVEGCITRVKQKLQSATSNEEAIQAIAEFHYNFLSIHPFMNGNGRVARLATEYFLDQVGLPPPVWTHFNEDIFLTQEQFTDVLRDSLVVSDKFHRDVKAVLHAGVDYRAVTPYLLPKALQRAGDFIRSEDYMGPFPDEPALGRGFFMPEDFATWIANIHQAAIRPNTGLDGLLNLYVEHNLALRDSEAKVSIRPFSPLFRKSFGLSPTQTIYNTKMKEFYEDGLIYRGASTPSSMSDQELLAHFTKSQAMTVGVAVSPTVSLGEVDRLFEEFNLSLYRNRQKLIKEVEGHSDADDGVYEGSRWVSLSRSVDVANEFMRGSNMDKEHLKHMKGGITVTGRSPKYGSLDRQAEFSDIAEARNSEKEVTLFGAIDPEAVQKVEFLDVNVLSPGNYLNKIPENMTVTRTRTVVRLRFNELKLTEQDSEGKIVRESYFKILPNGSIVEEKKQQKGTESLTPP